MVSSLASPTLRWTRGRFVCGVALFWFAVALIARGRTHPDEVFQALEPAHHLAFGAWDTAWEWRVGLRNWAVPGALAAVLWVLGKLGVSDAWTLVAGLWAGLAVAQALGVWALTQHVAERDGVGPGRLAGLMLASWGGFFIYAPRPLSDAVAIPPLLGALFWLGRGVKSGRLRDGLFAGGLLGLAVVARYGSIALVVMALGWLLFHRAWRPLVGTLLGGGTVALLLGALDWATWGAPFHSLREYVLFNQPAGEVVKHFGAQPWWWYLTVIGAMAPAMLAPWVPAGLKRGGLAAVWLVGYVLAIQLHPHKESRFLLPVIPLGVAVVAAPVHAWLLRVLVTPRRFALALATWVVYSELTCTLLRPFALDRALLDGQAECGHNAHGMILAAEKGFKNGGRFFTHRDIPVASGELSEGTLSEKLADPRYDCAMVDGVWDKQRLLPPAGFSLTWQEDDVTVWRRPAR